MEAKMGCGLSSAKAAYPREVRHLNIRGLPDRFAAPSDEPPPPATQAEKAQPSDEPNRSRLSTVFQEGEAESIDEEPVAGAPVPASAVALTQLPLAAVGSVTMVGYDPERSKINQDDFAADACFADDPTKAVFAVCDGHGPNGRRVANLLASQLVSTLASELDDDITVDRVFKRAFLKLNVQLLRSQIDCAISGSTCLALLVSGTRAYVANVGDSRCVAAIKISDSSVSNGALEAVEWSVDQKPEVFEEEQRLLAMGARLAPLGQGYDGHLINRIWLPDKDTPGIAMSRSFGDSIATTVGVISDPVVTEHELTADTRFVILATDGIWEFIGSQEAVEIVGKVLNTGGDLHQAVRKLVVEASRRWMCHEHLSDDITVIIVAFDPIRLGKADSASATRASGALGSVRV